MQNDDQLNPCRKRTHQQPVPGPQPFRRRVCGVRCFFPTFFFFFFFFLFFFVFFFQIFFFLDFFFGYRLLANARTPLHSTIELAQRDRAAMAAE